MNKNISLGVALLLVLGVIGYLFFLGSSSEDRGVDSDPTPQNVTLSGTYVCLPHLDTKGPQTEECAFGFKTDDGVYYAVNFGQSGEAMSQFQSGAHIKAEGFTVIKEALSTNQWNKYNMRGIFTITKVIESTLNPGNVEAKLNINVICEEALAYMTFPDGKSADKFVIECKEGKHPEVIEQYKEQMNLGEGAMI